MPAFATKLQLTVWYNKAIRSFLKICKALLTFLPPSVQSFGIQHYASTSVFIISDHPNLIQTILPFILTNQPPCLQSCCEVTNLACPIKTFEVLFLSLPAWKTSGHIFQSAVPWRLSLVFPSASYRVSSWLFLLSSTLKNGWTLFLTHKHMPFMLWSFIHLAAWNWGAPFHCIPLQSWCSHNFFFSLTASLSPASLKLMLLATLMCYIYSDCLAAVDDTLPDLIPDPAGSPLGFNTPRPQKREDFWSWLPC